MTDTRKRTLQELIAAALARYDALDPHEKAAHDYEQRRSFARGMCPDDMDYRRWCEIVDRALPPKAGE